MVRIEHILKEFIKDLKVRITELEKERDEARQEAKKWRDKAMHMWSHTPERLKPLPWET